MELRVRPAATLELPGKFKEMDLRVYRSAIVDRLRTSVEEHDDRQTELQAGLRDGSELEILAVEDAVESAKILTPHERGLTTECEGNIQRGPW